LSSAAIDIGQQRPTTTNNNKQQQTTTNNNKQTTSIPGASRESTTVDSVTNALKLFKGITSCQHQHSSAVVTCLLAKSGLQCGELDIVWSDH